MYRLTFALLLISFALISTTFATEKECFEQGKNCSEVDIDSPKAEMAFKRGCNAKDYYSCYRLGQFYELNKHNLALASNYYEISCKGEDKNGCDSLREAKQVLCYVQQKSVYCAKLEPVGDYRVMAYLRRFDPKYADAFSKHNFGNPWEVKEAKALYEKRKQEKNKKLLEVLEKELKSGKHDGADAEDLHYDVECMRGKCPDRNFE